MPAMHVGQTFTRSGPASLLQNVVLAPSPPFRIRMIALDRSSSQANPPYQPTQYSRVNYTECSEEVSQSVHSAEAFRH